MDFKLNLACTGLGTWMSWMLWKAMHKYARTRTILKRETRIDHTHLTKNRRRDCTRPVKRKGKEIRRAMRNECTGKTFGQDNSQRRN